MALPWTFPHSAGRCITFGKVSSIGIDSDNAILTENTAEPLHRYSSNSPLTRLRQRQFYWDKPLLYSRLQESIDKMVSLYRTRHVQADIPIDILTGSLHDELIFERNNCKFDKFAGNRMRIINNGKLIATAGGQTGSTLYTSLEQITTLRDPHITLEYKTPILQIGYSAVQPMLVTRSFQGLHYLKLFDRDFSSADLLNPVVEFGRQPVHFCTSPLLPEMAISLSDGSIHLGDLQTMQFTGLMNPIDFASVDDRQCFRACEYGAHPRSLLVWDAKSVSNVDFRMPGTQLWKRLYSSSSSAFISCVKRHPTSPFQFTVASNESVALVDTRYAVSPLLEWGVNNSYESQLFLEFSKKSTMETTTIYSWGRKQAEIVAYSCRQDAARPPTAYRPVSFAPYHNHPSLKEKYGAQVPFVYLEDLRTQEKIVDDLDVPDWPPLIGFDVLEGKKGVHMFFLADDSSIFTQYYSTQSLDSPDIELVQAKCESVEAKCAKLERSHATIAVPHDAIGYESATVDLSIYFSGPVFTPSIFQPDLNRLHSLSDLISRPPKVAARNEPFLTVFPQPSQFSDLNEYLHVKYADSAVDFQPHVDLASRILIPPSSHYADIDYTAKNSNYISRHPPLMLKSCWKAELVRLGAVASDLCNAWDEDDIDMPTAVKVRRVIKARPKPVPIVKVDTAKVVPSTQPQPQVSVDVHPQMYASQPVVGRFGTTEKPKKKRKSGF